MQSITLDEDTLSLRLDTGGLYDRVALYRRYGAEARISNALLRMPRRLLSADPVSDITAMLADMAELRYFPRHAGRISGRMTGKAQDVAISRA